VGMTTKPNCFSSRWLSRPASVITTLSGILTSSYTAVLAVEAELLPACMADDGKQRWLLILAAHAPFLGIAVNARAHRA
jgi:hypothetical protein